MKNIVELYLASEDGSNISKCTHRSFIAHVVIISLILQLCAPQVWKRQLDRAEYPPPLVLHSSISRICEARRGHNKGNLFLEDVFKVRQSSRTEPQTSLTFRAFIRLGRDEGGAGGGSC